MTLTANAAIARPIDQDIRQFPVAASVHIFKGSWVGLDPAGLAKPFLPGDSLVGLAYEETDNSAGAASAKKIRVWVQTDVSFALLGLADKHAGRAVYATGDDAVALVGHPDAFVGRVLHKDPDTGEAIIRLKSPGEKPLPSNQGSIDIAHGFGSPVTETGAAGAGVPIHSDGLRLVSALGLGVKNVAGAGGGVDLEFDAIAEVAQASIETPAIFLASKGVTFEARLHLPDIGSAVALDADWGLIDALTANARTNSGHGDVTDQALFHLDGAVASLFAQSDNNLTDVAPVDTTIANVTTAGSFKDFKIIVRPTGSVEFWIDGVRVLPATVFAVRPTAVLAGTINLEKTSDNTTAKLRVDCFRVAGANG